MSNENPLAPLREEIDRIDAELVRLLDRRAEIARLVGQSKAGVGMVTFDPGRAKSVVNQAISRSNGTFPREGLTYVFREVLSACLNLQKPLRVGFLGPQATFTHQAAIREFGSSVDFTAYRLNKDVFKAVENGWVDFGVVPVENSTGGIVHDTLDSFIDHQCMICSEILLPIHQSLLSNVTLPEVKKVYSHGQALSQCARWLSENLPDAELIEVASTVQGMIEAGKASNAAAIGSELAAEQYQLGVLAKRIEDNQDNTTRFLVISMQDSRPSGDDKTSLMFGVKDEPGSLLKVVKPFAELGINMSKIESRPTRKKAWEQAFFLDVSCHHSDPKFQEAVRILEGACESVRILGSYPREKSPRELDDLPGTA